MKKFLICILFLCGYVSLYAQPLKDMPPDPLPSEAGPEEAATQGAYLAAAARIKTHS